MIPSFAWYKRHKSLCEPHCYYPFTTSISEVRQRYTDSSDFPLLYIASKIFQVVAICVYRRLYPNTVHNSSKKHELNVFGNKQDFLDCLDEVL